MPNCSIIEGFALPCRDAVSGIRTLYITEFANITAYTDTSGTITSMTQAAGTKMWKYSLEKENCLVDEDDVNSVENGTRFWTQTLSFSLRKLTAKNRNNIKLVGQNRLIAIVETNNGDFKGLGFFNGLDLTTAKGTSGKSFGDKNGYDITLTGKETAPMYDVSSSVISTMSIGQ